MQRTKTHRKPTRTGGPHLKGYKSYRTSSERYSGIHRVLKTPQSNKNINDTIICFPFLSIFLLNLVSKKRMKRFSDLLPWEDPRCRNWSWDLPTRPGKSGNPVGRSYSNRIPWAFTWTWTEKNMQWMEGRIFESPQKVVTHRYQLVSTPMNYKSPYTQRFTQCIVRLSLSMGPQLAMLPLHPEWPEAQSLHPKSLEEFLGDFGTRNERSKTRSWMMGGFSLKHGKHIQKIYV